ncbi:hypothetical protein C8R44DRAFT_989640 [Mycena epipterygia]|nr:hypothetical protein C8R44DRAFT_989640 [Mycena epipterygia]
MSFSPGATLADSCVDLDLDLTTTPARLAAHELECELFAVADALNYASPDAALAPRDTRIAIDGPDADAASGPTIAPRQFLAKRLAIIPILTQTFLTTHWQFLAVAAPACPVTPELEREFLTAPDALELDPPSSAAVTALFPPQILALKATSASASTHQQPQQTRRYATFSPPDLTPTSTSHHWYAGAGGGFCVFPAASGVSSLPAQAPLPRVHLPVSSGSFAPVSASSPALCVGSGSARTHASSFSSPGSTAASAASLSSSTSSSGGLASSFTSSGGSVTPIPVFSTPAFTVGARDQGSAGEMTRDSPVLLASAATAVVNASLGVWDGHARPAPKNRSTKAPQGARLRAGCARWVV